MIRFAALASLLLLPGCESKPKPKEEKTMELESVKYIGWSESVSVEGRNIVHTKIEYEYDNPTSSVPSRQSTKKILDGSVTADQVAALDKLVRESGFLDLKDRYGAPEGHRYYPYRIEVTYKGQPKKTVEVRSNPEYEGQPEAFKKVESHLMKLSESARNK